MSLAAETRAAARAHPWLMTALRAGIVNYRAAASFLDIDGDSDSVARALRRFADTLDEFTSTDISGVTVRMHHGVDIVSDDCGVVQQQDESESDILLRVTDDCILTTDGRLSAIIVNNISEISISAFMTALGCVQTEEITITAAGSTRDIFIIVVPREEGANALRSIEAALTVIPTS